MNEFSILSDHLDFYNGKAHLKNKTGNINIYGSNGIIGTIDKSLYENGIVIGRVGAYCGSVFNIKSGFWATDNTIIAVPKTNVDQDFFYFLLKFLRLENLAGGAAQPLLTQNVLRRIKVKVPNFLLQRKIASILSAYDDLIEVNLQRIKLLEEASDLIYKEWFVNFRFPGHESIRFADGIPEGWEESSIFDFALIESGGTPKTTIREYWDGHIPFFTPTDYEERYVIYKTVRNLTDEGLSRCNSKLYPQNSVFITARGTVGKAMMNLSPMAINQSCYALNSINFSSNYFLFFTLRYLYAKVKKMAIGGVFDTIIVDTFKNLIFFRPEAELIIEFEELVKPFFDEMAVLVITIDKLKEARDLLLPKLMSGEIEV